MYAIRSYYGVEEDLLVGAGAYALAIAAAALLVHQHDTVLHALVDGPARAGLQARGPVTVVAHPRQVA